MRYLSIDYGNKITGLAICDPTETIVSPLAALPTSNDLIGKIIEIIKTENVEALVLGLPLNMDDSVGPQAKKVQAFAEQIKKQIDTPVFFQDERLSTFAAEGKMIEMELTRKGKKRRIDALAAAEIMQAFLDKKRSK
ncbi:MAG: Holliday junction resolvase RuvX [Sedimentisphaerales bacterium]|jgi:putative Holliday junction resolvase